MFFNKTVQLKIKMMFSKTPFIFRILLFNIHLFKRRTLMTISKKPFLFIFISSSSTKSPLIPKNQCDLFVHVFIINQYILTHFIVIILANIQLIPRKIVYFNVKITIIVVQQLIDQMNNNVIYMKNIVKLEQSYLHQIIQL